VSSVDATSPTREELLSEAPEATELERNRINLRWLVRLRWGAAAGQLLTVLGAFHLLALPLPLETLLALIATAAASNLLAAAWLRRAKRVSEEVLAGLMGLDVLVLTGLLALSGGPFNPFSTLYLIYIALAAVVLRPAWTWGLVSFALACFGMLFVAPIRTEMEGAIGQGAHGAHVRLHLEGMWVAFGVGAAFIVYFVQRVTSELARRDRELADVRSARARTEQLASLATLAAGAAHELASPLSTIAVVARELERRLGRASADALGGGAAVPTVLLSSVAAASPGAGVEPMLDDARLIREQVDRCREILDRMAGEAGETPGEPFAELTLGELIALSTGELGSGRVDIALDPASGSRVLKLPRRAVAQALRALTKNALEASDGAKVVLAARIDDGRFTIEIRDRGHGMAADVLSRVGEPFFTTKGPGAGMGLGVFLARTVLASLGGELEFASRPGRGTTARVRLPAVAGPDARDRAATIH
jgi:two-component system, sensor histidine kinase RegB